MARFPRREATVESLAQTLATGLADNTGKFPAPPVSPAEIQALLDAFKARDGEAVAARAAAEQATDNKKAAFVQLTRAMKACLRYAEDAVHREDAPLSLLGWGARSAPTALQPPGQPATLTVPRHGEGWVFLHWDKPIDGGAVASYKVERRERPSGEWTLIAVAMEPEATVDNQERGKDLEYRVIAGNRAGESMPSNTVAVVV